MRPYDLKDYEIQTALRFFTYHMEMDQRDQLMREFPVIYNKLMGDEYVVSISKRRLDSLNIISADLPDHADIEEAQK
jgi:hypothetical protein|tara:strand:- start:388 stop:618 length:231 start_codon:yes stop_codon:yes gene_type:complete